MNFSLRNKYSVVLPKLACQAELDNICACYSKAHRLGLEDRVELVQLSRAEGKYLELRLWESALTFGSGSDLRRVERQFRCQGQGRRFIRRLTLKTVIWDERVVIGRVIFLLTCSVSSFEF